MAAAAVIIIINRPRQNANRELAGSPETFDHDQIQVLIDPEASDAEVLRAALAQVERDQA